MGVFNVFLKDANGNVLSSYDPKGYGEVDTGKYEIKSFEEIIGVYGTHPDRNSNIFSSLSLIVMSRSKVVRSPDSAGDSA